MAVKPAISEVISNSPLALLERHAGGVWQLKTEFNTERKILIMREMALTAEEAEAFWPLYDEYVNARRALGDKRVGIITDYAANYMEMTDEMAGDLLKRSLAYETNSTKLKSLLQEFCRPLRF